MHLGTCAADLLDRLHAVHGFSGVGYLGMHGRTVHQDLTHVRAQALEHPVVDHNEVQTIDVLIHGHEFLDLKQLAIPDGGRSILLPVNHTLLQRGDQLGESNGCGRSTHRPHEVDIDLRLHGAHLQALQVIRVFDLARVVGQVAKAVF